MSNDDLTEYEEQHREDLVDDFIEANRDKYDDFVFDAWIGSQAEDIDAVYEQMRDDEIFEKEKDRKIDG